MVHFSPVSLWSQRLLIERMRLSVNERHLPHTTSHASTHTVHHSTSIKPVSARTPAVSHTWIP